MDFLERLVKGARNLVGVAHDLGDFFSDPITTSGKWQAEMEEKEKEEEEKREDEARRKAIAEIGLSETLYHRMCYCAAESGLPIEGFITQAVARSISMAEKHNSRRAKRRESAEDNNDAKMDKALGWGLSMQLLERVDICAERAGLSRKEFVINAITSATDAAEIRIARLERLQR